MKKRKPKFLIERVCDECGYIYRRLWYEPKWLAYRYINSEEAHPFAHAQYMEWDTNPEKHELVVKWREWERNRIVGLLEKHFGHLNIQSSNGLYNFTIDVIEMIRNSGDDKPQDKDLP